MMKNKKLLALTSVLILLPVAAGLLLWDALPEQIPNHWNAAGEVDGWTGKAGAVFVMPLFLLAMHWLCVVITTLDPKNKNQTPKVTGLVLWIIPVLSLAVNGMVYATALGVTVRVERLMPVLLGVMFAIIGNYLPKCRRNSTIGIKLPWTLESDANWNATHRLAGKLWVAGGIGAVVCGFLPGSVWWLLGILLIMTAIPVVYSYSFYRRNEAGA